MTVSPDVQQCIRRMDADGAGPTEIAEALGVCRNSVYKYSRMEDLSPQPPVAERRKRPAIDRYADFIVGMLADDRSVPGRQRHSAQKIFDRLIAERGYAGSYPTVCRFVREWKLAQEQSPRDGLLELDWAPGAMQAGYGTFTATVAGERLELKLLVATFPHSNVRFCIAMMCEKAECFCEGLVEIFEMAGRAPRLVVLDNATEAGRMLFGRVTESKLFSRLRAHYRFEARFCNPDSGNERGSVENAVGFLRRDLLVPVPSVPSLDALNSMPLSGCRRINATAKSGLRGPAPKAFAEDLAAMMALPGVRFDSVRWVHVRSDKRGYMQLDGVSYCAGPAWHGRDLLAGAGARAVEIVDMRGRHVASLPRSWRQGELVRNPASLVPALVARPRAFGESVIRGDMPEALLSHMDRLGKDDPRRALRAIGRASDASGFDAACRAAERLFAEGGVPDDASCDVGSGAEVLAERVAAAGARCSLTKSLLADWGVRGTPRQVEYLAEYLEAECASRDASRKASPLRRCALPQAKTFDGYDWTSVSWPEGLGRADLLSLSFLERREDLVLMGDVGTGKTHMLEAICSLCCQQMRPARFFTASSLVMRLRRARDAGSLDRELAQLAKADILGIDELGFLPLDTDGARLLFQVISESYERQSLVITTNLEFARWGAVFGDDQMAAAVIDRICHHGRLLKFSGESWRMRHALISGDSAPGGQLA